MDRPVVEHLDCVLVVLVSLARAQGETSRATVLIWRRQRLPLFLACTAVVAVLVAGAVRFAPRTGLSRAAHAWRVAASDVRHGLLARRAWPAITAASLVVVVGHVSVFVIAAHAVGAHVSLRVLMPLALLVLVSAALPTNIGGWGPREGVAAWVFASASLGADHGVATATAFGLLMLIAPCRAQSSSRPE